MSFTRTILFGSLGIAGAYTSAFAYFKYNIRVCKSTRDLNERTVIVTGADTGIGLETARDLAARNARVILACRTQSKGEKAMEDIVQSTGNANVVVKELDVSSFESVRVFANDVLKYENRLDVLVNNKDVTVFPEENVTAERINRVMATNHYGPFFLTNLLLPLMKDSAPSRIVVVSSLPRRRRGKNRNRVEDKLFWEKLEAYGKSKVAALFVQELSTRLKGTGVTVNAAGLNRNENRKCDNALQWLLKPFKKNVREQAQTCIYVAVSEDLEGVSGKYFSNCREKYVKQSTFDDYLAKKLWEHSETVTGLEPSSSLNEDDFLQFYGKV